MSKKVNEILGLINEAHKETKTQLASQRIELGKGKQLLDQAEMFAGDLDFFINSFELTSKALYKALEELKQGVGALTKVREEINNQGEDALSVSKQAAQLAVKMDKIAEDLVANDLDANSVMDEVKKLDQAAVIGKEVKKRADDAKKRVDNLLDKI